MIEINRVDKYDAIQMNDYLRLLENYALDPMAGNQSLPTKVKQNLASEILQRHYITLFLAYHRDIAIGLITLMEGFSTFQCLPLINIHDVYVIPDYRGQGVATKLLTAAEQFAQQKLCCKLTLEVLDGNTLAKKSYQNFGFNSFMLDPTLGGAVFWEKKLVTS